MCFTPFVSISVAIIEFSLATILLAYFKRTKLRDFFSIIIYVLGLYQFTEFMLCTTSYPLFWAKAGFITYSFLPAIGLHAAYMIFKRKANLLLIYFIPVMATVLAITSSNFITSAVCTSVFVEVSILLRHGTTLTDNVLYLSYLVYYFGFIVMAALVIIKDYWNNKGRIRKMMDLAILAGIILMIVPTFIFVVVFPFLSVRFPSVLCGFAIFTAIFSFAAAYLEKKLKSSKG